MDMNFALEAIHDYCENLQDTGIAEDRKKLHLKLRALNTMVWADDYSEEALLELILEIHEMYESIADKQPYVEIMKVVRYFQDFTVRTWKRKPSHIEKLLIKLEKFGK